MQHMQIFADKICKNMLKNLKYSASPVPGHSFSIPASPTTGSCKLFITDLTMLVNIFGSSRFSDAFPRWPAHAGGPPGGPRPAARGRPAGYPPKTCHPRMAGLPQHSCPVPT